ncbi:MAG: hypothetical protein H7138_10830 [Myxococcales bacterium]|nr:hypothetical protein [Myxococcales bacterium]
MTCERYWREGVVLVERGLDDPHRADCAECTTAHASRQELIEALPLVGADRRGDPRWQNQVWQRIDGERAPPPIRWRWPFAAALALVCAIVLWTSRGKAPSRSPVFELHEDGVAMRSTSTIAGARLRIRADETSEIWIYRADHLIVRCAERQKSEVCARDSDGIAVDLRLTSTGRYHAFVVDRPTTPPRGNLDEDRAALESANIGYVARDYVAR